MHVCNDLSVCVCVYCNMFLFVFFYACVCECLQVTFNVDEDGNWSSLSRIIKESLSILDIFLSNYAMLSQVTARPQR